MDEENAIEKLRWGELQWGELQLGIFMEQAVRAEEAILLILVLQ